jgi:hypothetical protein
MRAYVPREDELLAQQLPGYWRLRQLVDLETLGVLDGRQRDEAKALAAEFMFHWRIAKGTDGGFLSTLNMAAGLTVAGQNPKFNQFMNGVAGILVARPTPVRPNLRLEIKPRYTQKPVAPAPALDKLRKATPSSKVDVYKYREINLGSRGEADHPDMLHLNISLDEIKPVSGGKIVANFNSMPEIPSNHFKMVRGRNVQIGMPSEIELTAKEIFRITNPEEASIYPSHHNGMM